MGHAVNVTDATFAAEVETAPELVIVDFWATWCGPCRIIAPMLDQLAQEHAGRVKVAKLDVDENTATVTRFNVRSAPTLLFFKDGKPVSQIVGAVPRARIESQILQHA
jgi:thioredoxin